MPFLASAQAVLRELPGLVSDRVEIFALEMHRAGQVLARMVALALAAAVFAATAWIALWGGIVFVMAAFAVPWLVIACVVLGVNVLAAWFAIACIFKLAPRLGLPVTRRHLIFKSRTADDTDEQTGDQKISPAVIDEPAAALQEQPLPEATEGRAHAR